MANLSRLQVLSMGFAGINCSALAAELKVNKELSQEISHGLRTSALYGIPMLLVFLATKVFFNVEHVQAPALLAIGLLQILPPALMAYFNPNLTDHTRKLIWTMIAVAGCSNGLIMSALIS